jgi:hypothetical protein
VKTPEVWAKGLAKGLLGDEDADLPTSHKPIWRYFASMPLHRAMDEFRQLQQMPEGDRLRDLMERTGEDGRT